MLLLKIFIENNEICLHTFEVEDDYFIELILKNSNFIRNIKILKFYFNKKFINMKIIDPLIKFFHNNCKSISSLHFQLLDNKYDSLIDKYLSQIIDPQQNLKKISFEYYEFPLNNSLLSLKNNLNYLITLETITFYGIDFKNMINLNEIIEELNGLESIHVLSCHSINSDFIKQIINITKPFKLKSLIIYENFHIDSYQSLLQKSGDYLENIGFESCINDELKQQLIEIIMKYCKKIKFFELHEFNKKSIYLVFDLIKIIEKNLNYISIDINILFYFNYDHIELSSIVLLNLGQILPFKLEYLNLTLNIDIKDFIIFLKNSQNTFIKKLLIKTKIRGDDDDDDLLPFIKEYIMKKKRVNYFAFEEVNIMNDKNLFSMKDEVKEFELYNIKVQNYSDLYIHICDMIDIK